MRRPKHAIPKEIFREMKLGIVRNGYATVVAGVTWNWWEPEPIKKPVKVRARILPPAAIGDCATTEARAARRTKD